ncbi:hypothetical protein [Azoarcus olearius]|nr:hypothetical protein [Azoarcus olearius]
MNIRTLPAFGAIAAVAAFRTAPTVRPVWRPGTDHSQPPSPPPQP